LSDSAFSSNGGGGNNSGDIELNSSSKTAIDICCFTSMIFGAYTTFFSRDEFEIRCIKLEPTRNKIPQPFHLLHASKILVITLAFGSYI